MTEQQIITEILNHINSGKIFMLGAHHLLAPGTKLSSFLWDFPGEPEPIIRTILQPITIGRMLSKEDIKENWYEGHKFERLYPYYFEVILD